VQGLLWNWKKKDTLNLMAKDFLQKKTVNAESLIWLRDTSLLPKAADWIKAMRETGYESFSETVMPSFKLEDWKYSNLRKLRNAEFSYSAEKTKFDVKLLPQNLLDNTKRIVVIDGKYCHDLSNNIKEITVTSLAEANIPDMEQYLVTVGDLDKEPMKALNSAYMQDGVVIKIEKNIAEPIEVLFYNTGNNKAIYTRNLYWMSKDSSATIIENYAGKGVYFFNSYTAIVQHEKSQLKLYRFEKESPEAFHFSSINIQQHNSSIFESFTYAEGGIVARTEYKSELVDKNSENKIGGLYLLNGDQIHDFKIVTQHLEPECKSSQHFRGALDGHSQANLQGKIYVARNAQKTDAYQINRSILLSKDAKMNVKPELEIYADDVKCGHGASSGQLDKNAIFYMQSRGIEEQDAKSLLVQSFLNEALEQVSFAPVKELYESMVVKWLKK